MLGESRQAFYKHDEDQAFLLALMLKMALEFVRLKRKSDAGLGGVKLWRMYTKEFGDKLEDLLGRDVFLSLLRENGLLLRKRTSSAPKTTDSRHKLPVYPNLVYDVIPTRPNEIWVSDITYIEVIDENGERYFVYLTLIMDSYTKEVVGWSVGDSLEKEHAIRALEMALSSREIEDNMLTHHSDRGTQYASKAYTDILKEHKIKISMTENGDPKQNAQAERLNCTFKDEFFKDIVFRSPKMVEDAVRSAVDFYNNERPHMSLDFLTPSEAFQHTGELKKRWHSYREQAIKNKANQPEAATAL